MPSRSLDGERVHRKHDDVRHAAPPRVGKELLVRPASVHTQLLAAGAPAPTRLDSRIEDLLRTKRAGVVRDYASITQLQREHSSPSTTTRKSAAHSTATASPSHKAPLALKAPSHVIIDSNNSSISAATTKTKATKLTLKQRHHTRNNQLVDAHDVHHWHSPSSKASHEHNSHMSALLLHSPRTTAVTTAALSDSSVELSEIQQSIQRLRAQRTHVEQLREHNARLETLVHDHAREREQLRSEVATLRGVAQENVGLLQSCRLLEERLQSLEAAVRDKHEALAAAHARTADAEAQCRQFEAAVLAREHDHAERVDTLQAKQTALVDQIRQLERDRNAFADTQQRAEQQWRDRLQQEQQQTKQWRDRLQQEQQQTKQLGRDVAAFELQVQTLLATTVRQTSVIEDCDRVLSETKTQQRAAKKSYHDQLEVNRQLKVELEQLATQLHAVQTSSDSERAGTERRLGDLERKLRKRKDRIEILQVALHERDKQLETMQHETATQRRSVEHVEGLNDDLRRRERALMSELSELRLALGDVTDEKKILTDQFAALEGK